MERLKIKDCGLTSIDVTYATKAFEAANYPRLELFKYDNENGNTFSECYSRYSKIIVEEGKGLTDDAKVRILIDKLKSKEFRKFLNGIKLKKTL